MGAYQIVVSTRAAFILLPTAEPHFSRRITFPFRATLFTIYTYVHNLLWRAAEDWRSDNEGISVVE